MKRRGSGSMSRRDFVKTALTAAAVVPFAGSLLRAREARAEEEALVTDLPDQAAMVAALQYVNESVKPDQNCTSCQFFTLQGEGPNGKCQLFPTGAVTPGGWCASWAKKIT